MKKGRGWGWAIIVMAMLYGVMENRVFGYNVFPGSQAELLADGICAVIASIGMGVLAVTSDK